MAVSEDMELGVRPGSESQLCLLVLGQVFDISEPELSHFNK